MSSSPKASCPVTRRCFVAAIAAGAALAPAVRAAGMGAASERVRLGLVGCGGRGRELLSVFCQWPDVEVPVVSDVIEPRMDEAAKILVAAGRKPPERVVEHERILDRGDVDPVLIATTQHWHGRPFIQAALAGKAIYVEKPLSHTVAEGRAMVDAAEKTGVLAVMGVQQRYSEIKRVIVECLMVNPYIKSIDTIDIQHEGDTVDISITLTTIYGEVSVDV